jgi:aminoglycoside 3-N-acetyltransferase
MEAVGEAEVIRSTTNGPVTQERIANDLAALGITPGMAVIVHSSLSRIGWVAGGAVAVIRALQAAVRSYGTLIMPAHSGDLSDPELWENPPVPREWWQPIRDHTPAFDPEVTPTRGVGVIAELFRTFPDVVRSSHPHVSFSGWGEQAVEILGDHALEDSLGESSPLSRLYEADGQVLLLGAWFDSNTSFHLAEYRADDPTRERVTLGAPVVVDGHRRWKSWSDINYRSDDFSEIGKAFVKANKQIVKVGKVGDATCHLFPQRACVDFAARWMHTHRRK